MSSDAMQRCCFVATSRSAAVLAVLASLVLGALALSGVAWAEEPPARNPRYPSHWWEPVSKDGAPEWEILPQEAGPGEVILSKRHELGLLSNFAATPFDFRGKRYASLEGFWQMMKYPENDDDPRAKFPGLEWKYTRDEVAGLTSFEAKQAGDLASANMKRMGIDWVTFEGRQLPYRPAEPGEHYRLIVEATREKVRQNPKVKQALLSTGDLVLRPDHHQGPNPPAAWRYYEILTDIRKELQEERASHNDDPVVAERIARIVALPDSLDERLKLKLRDARLGHQRVLLIVGPRQSPLVEELFELEYANGLEGLMLEYLIMPMAIGGTNGEEDARQLLSTHGIAWPQRDDVTLAVLDEAGGLAVQTACSKLFSEGRIDQPSVVAFLQRGRPELPDAQQLLANAIARAKAEDKRVLVQVSGPRCGWCIALSRYLDDHHEAIDKEFIYVKLDERFEHGKEVIERVRTDSSGGIPWMVILDEDEKPLITSNGPGGNIGFPVTPEEQTHFEKMLRTSPRHLSEDDIQALLKALRN